MTRPLLDAENAVIETWELAFPGMVSVWVYDRRDDQYKKQYVGARSGSKTLHISRDDRKYNQELIPDENRSLDPFLNGQLRLLGSADRDESLDVRNHLSNADLLAMFEVREVDLFNDLIEGITSEVILNRLRDLAETSATLAQSQALRDLIQKRYPVGGTQRTVREMLEAGERIGATRL